MQHLVASLQSLGLTEKEARVYLALLQLGSATPYQIAKRADIKRPTAYVIAEELVEKNIIIQTPGEEPRKYIARTPESVLEDHEARIDSVRQMLPELKSLQKESGGKPNVLYFEGVNGVQQAMEFRKKELEGKEVVGFFASGADISPEMNQIFFDYNEYRKRHNIRLRGVTVDDPSVMPYVEQFAKEKPELDVLKLLPKGLYSARVSLEVCGEFSRIILMESAQALIIDSPKFAEAMRQIFEMVWDSRREK